MTNRYDLNKNLAQMLKGGVIMDVQNPEQARIAEAAGAADCQRRFLCQRPWHVRDH